MQRNGARLPHGHDFVVDFARVVSIDAGAGFGIVDGIVFTKEANRSLKMKLTNIKQEFIDLLKKCGLPKYVGINGAEPEEHFGPLEDEKDLDTQSRNSSTHSSLRKRKTSSTTTSTTTSVESL